MSGTEIKRWIRNMLIILSVFFHSCTKDSGPISVLPDPPLPNDTVSFSNDVMVIMQIKCWFCHPTSGNLDLGLDSAYAQLVNVETTSYAPEKRIVPFDTASSVLYQKIMGDQDYGVRMPPGNSATLTQQEIEIFGKWIMQGAQNN